MEMKQQEEKLYKTYSTFLYNQNTQNSISIEDLKLCLVSEDNLTQGLPSRETMIKLQNGTERQAPVNFPLQQILQEWLNNFIRKNPKYRHKQDLSIFEVIDPDTIAYRDKLMITHRITQNLQDLADKLSGKIIIETIRERKYFIYESSDQKLYYINPNVLISGMEGIGFEVNDKLNTIISKKTHLRKNIDFVIRDNQLLYKAAKKSESLEQTGVLVSFLHKPVSFLSRFNENTLDTVFATHVPEDVIRKIYDIQRHTSYSQLQVRHSGKEIRLHLYSSTLDDSLEIHNFSCQVPAQGAETVYQLGDYLCSVNAKTFTLLRNGVFLVDLQDEAMVIVICKMLK